MPRNFVPDSVLDRLIDLVRQNPAIFDPSRKDHKDAIKITNTWNSIAQILNWVGENSENTKEKKSTESTTSRGKKKKSYDAIDRAFLDLCENTKKRRESSLENDEAFLEPYVYRLKNMSKDVKGVVQLQIAQIFFNAENRHLPPQPIIPLPPLTLTQQMQTQVEHPGDWCQQQQNIIPNIMQTDRYPSETCDIVAAAMKELH